MQPRLPSLSAAAQPGAQGDAGLRFGVFPLLSPPAPLSSGVGHQGAVIVRPKGGLRQPAWANGL